MIRQYYKLNTDDSKKLLEQYHLDVSPNVEKRAEMVAEFKKDFHTTGRTVYRPKAGGRTMVLGYEVEGSDRIPKWANRESFNEGDSKHYYLVPKRNFKRGKEFEEWLIKINRIEIPSFNEYITGQALIEQPHIIFNSAVHYAVAGFAKGHVVMSVPTNEETPVVLSGKLDMEQIKKSEYIALVEE